MLNFAHKSKIISGKIIIEYELVKALPEMLSYILLVWYINFLKTFLNYFREKLEKIRAVFK